MTTNQEHNEEASLRARLAADARDVDAMSMLALTIAERYGSVEESKVMLNKALEIDPRNPKTLCSVAEFTLKFLGDEKAATDRVNEAVALVLGKSDHSASVSAPASVSATAASAAASAAVTAASGPHPNKHVVLRFAAQYFAEMEASKEDSEQNEIAEMYFREAADAARAAGDLGAFASIIVDHADCIMSSTQDYTTAMSLFNSILGTEPPSGVPVGDRDGLTWWPRLIPPHAHVKFGSFLREVGDAHSALAVLQRATEAHPQDPDCSFAFGDFMDSVAGDKAAALALYERVLALQPTHVMALNNQGTIFVEHGDLGKAKELFARADALAPGYCAYNLACVAALEGKGEECQAWLVRVLENGGLSAEQLSAQVGADGDFDKVRGEAWFAQMFSQQQQ